MSDALPAELQPVAPTLRLSRPLVLDLATSYLLSLARVGAAASVVAILYRHTTAAHVAVFVVARSMLAIINLLFAGAGPATLHELRRAEREEREASVAQVAEPVPDAGPASSGAPIALEYAAPRERERVDSPMSLHMHAWVAALGVAALVLVLVFIYAAAFPVLHRLQASSKLAGAAAMFVPWFACGLLARVTSDPAGAALQRRGLLSVDNVILLLGEALWLWWAVTSISPRHADTLVGIAHGYALSGFAVWFARVIVAPRGPYLDAQESHAMLGRWFAACAVIAAGSLGDLFYGSASVLIINQFLSADALAQYAPAMQIDGALLLCVAAISSVLLPRASAAAAADDRQRLRRMFITASTASVILLTLGSAAVLLLHRPLLSRWLGTVPPATAAILPLVLVHTVVGGTAGVGRAVLLGMGRFRAYTISALVGGIANVALALTFVVGLGWGLRGIVLATIIAVTIRCAIWMPWYILRALRVAVPSPVTPGEG